MAAPRICSVNGCDKPHIARGYCRRHYALWWKNGTPAAINTPKGDTIRFLQENVSFIWDECLIWPYSRYPNGYGKLTYKGQRVVASRLMCALAHGEPAEGMVAAHSCNNGHLGCVNPRHLRWATQRENIHDKYANGTHPRGEDSVLAKLTENKVREIRRSPPSEYRNLAALFGVSIGTVQDAASGRTWQHIVEGG